MGDGIQDRLDPEKKNSIWFEMGSCGMPPGLRRPPLKPPININHH